FTAGAGTPAVSSVAPEMTEAEAGSSDDMQTRIDEAPKPSLAGALSLSGLKSLIDASRLEAVLHLESSSTGADGTFLSSDAVLALRSASPWDAEQVKRALTSAVESYQSVNALGLEWQDINSGGSTASQWNGLIPMTIYVDGRTLWLARTPVLLGEALSHTS